ncbi:SDR family oxidoreductase [Paenarthrobacter sp. NPDC090522]|uniref:SDR family oxidoreductase n=1 Tax=Paenarthrobacter sp. NPDC090522 TaxID=3364383 RepID=UPI0038075FEC
MPGNSKECRVIPAYPSLQTQEFPLQPSVPSHSRTVLVTGATGYIGGRLVPRLLEAGHRVKVLVRSPQKIKDVPWHDQVEIVQDSLDDAAGVEEALAGVEVLYYLVHSMASGSGFEAKEEAMARLVAEAAKAAGVDRIVYLGGLHPDNELLSKHMRSREKVGRVFLESGVDSIVFQAGVVIGSGSASFEMIRHLADTLPVMPAPSWVTNRIEAIAVRDVLHYLVAAATLPDKLNRTFDIGSRDVLKYKDMMNEYALERGLPRRLVIALPVPAPKLAGLWVALVTPIPLSMSFPLVQSLQHDAVSREHDVDHYIPQPDGGLTPYRRAVALALGKERDGQVETTWANAGIDADPLPSDPDWAGYKVYLDERSFHSEAKPEHVWTIIEGIGGKNGWYSLPLAWRVRGWLDKLQGGAGLLRGRRHPKTLGSGEVVDWWRVEAIERGHLLRLRAEMRAPGRAWLELAVEPDGGGSLYKQRAIFFPRGLAGRLYWLGVYPFHGFIFPSMARNISAAAIALQEEEAVEPGSGVSTDTP